MTDELENNLWVRRSKKKSDDPEERVEEALQKALDNTTPEKAGVPWDNKEERERNEPRGRIPEA